MDITKKLSPFVAVEKTASVAAALATLRGADAEFILVTAKVNQPKEAQPFSVLREAELIALADNGSQKLSGLLPKCPPLLVVEDDDLKPEGASRDILNVLMRTGAACAVVHLKDASLGVVSAQAFARLIPIKDIALMKPEKMEASVSARTYVCLQCAPPRRKRPRTGGPPNCDVWSHGVMQPE